jgi:transcriptional antiterminator NusG
MQERKNGVFAEVLRIMFPGYVLVQSEDIFSLAKHTAHCKGLLRFLKSEGDFQEIRLEEISQIVYMVDEEGAIGFSEILAEGGYVKVLNGPLKGHEGKIKKIDKHHRRAKVLFKFDGQDHVIELGISLA